MAFTLTTFTALLDAFCVRASVAMNDTTGVYAPTVQQKATAARLLTEACEELWRFGNQEIILASLMEVVSVTPTSGVIARASVQDTSKWSVWTQDPRASWTAQDGLWTGYRLEATPDTDGLRVADITADTSLVVFYQREAPRFDWRDWATTTAYAVGDVRINAGQCYKCLEAHTSGTFATDLAADKWRLQQVPAEMSQVVIAKMTELRAGNVTQRPGKEAIAIVTARAMLEELYLTVANKCPPWQRVNGGLN